MHPLSKQFADCCEKHFNLEHQVIYPYKSLPICIIDCVYSLRAKYETVTLPVVQRYADSIALSMPVAETFQMKSARFYLLKLSIYLKESMRD